MKKLILIISFLASSFTSMKAQNNSELPYAEIPEYPSTYTDCTVAARMIDGLGFRFYWASEGLTEKDLNYKTTDEARTTLETIDHVLGLSQMILNASLKEPNGERETLDLSYSEKRSLILNNLKKAADILREAEDLSQFTLVFDRGGNVSEFPFWNNINGPIADAIWHTGQIVLLRRASGNPFNSKVSVFSGTVRQ